VKTPEVVLGALRSRVASGWHLDLGPETSSWPRIFALGGATRSELEANFAEVQGQASAWRSWSGEHGLGLALASRRVHGSEQVLPTHVTIPDLDTAARLLGSEWEDRIRRGRRRLSRLHEDFPDVLSREAVVRAVDSYSDVDFELLCSAAHWFARNPGTGLTPRQVPLEGIHAKWLNTHQAQVSALAGLVSLGLEGPHPQRIHFSYLDPDHRDSGGRWHDSASVGDRMIPAYQPDVVLIAENKDSAVNFPALAHAVSIEGEGFAAARAIASFPWVRAARRLFYWGDLDPAGFEIVNAFRTAGLDLRTIFMDLRTFRNYERFGATTDAAGKPLGVAPRKSLPLLTPTEQELYLHLTDPEWTSYRRVEQERIPLSVVAAFVRDLLEAEGAGR
jgi:hypothetical protein